MASLQFDLIVIGGGSGGLAGAFRAARHGARVALLEPAALGGTCVNVGCVPKKAMWLAADVAHRLRLAERLGFAQPQGVTLDWPELIASRQRYIAGIHASYRARLDEAGIVTLPMRGRLQSPRSVIGDDGTVLNAPHVLIATGAHATRPDIPGAELAIDSDGFFGLCAAPPRVAVIGGGYIAVELGCQLQALGSRVDLFVRDERLLPAFDADLTGQLAADMRHHGSRIHFDERVSGLQRSSEGGLQLQGVTACADATFDTVLFATGRRANTADLGLEALAVETDDRGRICVDAFQDTSIDGIHAVGDVTHQVALTPVAIAAARRLMDRLFGGDAKACVQLDAVPTVVFAHPPLAKIGLTEAEAREQHGDAVQVFTSRFRPMLHALAESPQRSLFKLVCVGNERRVVGIHLLGEGADEILQGFAVALRSGITLHDLHDTLAIHPTSAEELVLMG
ncbi:MAG: glutathione-disulfide reductase [Pseudoxanthomonas suwonensis]|nr:MAG: glutathione-disulfide reductase [Pseudoxanthomonas suwonensis]